MERAYYSIIVTTSDKYIGLLKLFFYYITLNWDISNVSIIIVGETINPNINSSNAKSIIYGNEANWSKLVDHALKFVYTEYVFLLMEDAFVLSRVNKVLIGELLAKSTSMNLDYLRFDSRNNTDRFRKFKPNNDKISINNGLWKVDFLKRNLRSNENAWDFEFNSLLRFRFFSSKLYYFESIVFPIPSGGVIVKGKINPEIDYDKVFLTPDVDFFWNDIIELNGVTTTETTLLNRLIRIIPRYIKLFSNLFFNKIKN